MKFGAISSTVALTLTLSSPAWAAPLFSDVTSDHWASDAVRELAGRGLIQGCPDATFQGDRCLTRWEMASLVARVMARLEENQTSFATKAELEELNRLIEHLRPELQALGARVQDLEKKTSLLDTRVSELERITYYGRLHAIGVSNALSGSAKDSNLTCVDWTTGRVMSDGEGFTMTGIFGLNVNISDSVNAGLELAAYAGAGKDDINAYWGTESPFASNVWTTQGGIDPINQPNNQFPFTRMVLDSMWVNHTDSGTRFVAGSFRPRLLGSYVFNGARNPALHGGEWLPFHGLNLSGSIGEDSGVSYEAFYTENPGKSQYKSHSYGGTLRYDFCEGAGRVAINAVNHRNERISDGAMLGVGAIPLPSVPNLGGGNNVAATSWLGTHAGSNLATANNVVGPQQQFSYGIDASYTILPDWGLTVAGTYGGTNYNPDTTGLLYNENVKASMYNFGLSLAPVDGFQLDVNYQSVDPAYDPFISQYAADTCVPVYLPYGNFYSGYYQMHDYINLPNNRRGFKAMGRYEFQENKTWILATYSDLHQIKATTAEQCMKVGNIEPVFNILTGDGNENGYIQGFGLGVGHTFDCGLQLDANYYHYNIARSAALAADDMKLDENLYRLDLVYPINNDLKLRANYINLTYKGHSGLAASDICQNTPGIGLDYQMTNNVAFAFDYRYIDFKQKAFEGADYTVNQVMLETMIDF